MDDKFQEMVHRSRTSNIRRISHRIDAGSLHMWRNIHGFGLHHFHEKTVQAVQRTVYIARMEFCYLHLGSQQLHVQSLFTDEVNFNRRYD